MNYNQEYYAKNKERILAKQAEYYKNNRAYVRDYQQTYYQKNVAKIRQQKQIYYESKHPPAKISIQQGIKVTF